MKQNNINNMKTEILSNLSRPSHLERLYRNDRTAFRNAFTELYPDIRDNSVAAFWNERLNYRVDKPSRPDLTFVIVGALLAGLFAKFPAFFNINEEFFYPRNAGFIIFPVMAVFFAWKNKLSGMAMVALTAIFIASAIFINFLPKIESDTLILSCIHLIIFLWFLTGIAFTAHSGAAGRIEYLRFNGDLVIMSGLIVIAGGILTGITLALFSLLGYNIEQFYFENVVLFGLPAAPIIGTYLTRSNPNLVGRISPVIAKIFSPLVLVMLASYLFAIVYSGKDPYNDREFLLIFNALLVGVMAIIFFSVSEAQGENKGGVWILLVLSFLTIIVNGIALSAILFRISEWGLTPNRAAVTGSNLLMLINLLIVTWKLIRVTRSGPGMQSVRNSIAAYLPVYFIWVALVTFLFPLLFNFA